MKSGRKVKVVVYGVGSEERVALGGVLWLRKVSEVLKKYDDVEVYKVPGPQVSNNRVKNILSAYVEGFKVLIMRPDAIIAGAGKDGNAALALLHKFISRKN